MYFCNVHLSCFPFSINNLVTADISVGYKEKPSHAQAGNFILLKARSPGRGWSLFALETTEQLVWKIELNVWAGSCPSIPERYSFSLLKDFPVSSWTHCLLWQAKAAQSNLSPGLMILCRKQFSPERPEIRECLCCPPDIMLDHGYKLAGRYIVIYCILHTCLQKPSSISLSPSFFSHWSVHIPVCFWSLTLDRSLSKTLFLVFPNSESDWFANGYSSDLYLIQFLCCWLPEILLLVINSSIFCSHIHFQYNWIFVFPWKQSI